MNTETAKLLRAHLAAAIKIIDDDTAKPSAEPESPVTTSPLPPAFPATGIVNGHSAVADEDGFVTIPAVSVILAAVPEKVRAKLPRRFCLESSYRNARFPSDIAREKCHRNLSNRYHVPGSIGVFNTDALLYRVESVSREDVKDDFNSPPEAKATHNWVGQDIAMLDGDRAWSSDWNPEFDAVAMTKLVRARANAELEAAGLKLRFTE